MSRWSRLPEASRSSSWRHQVLACAFSHHDDGMTPLQHPSMQARQQPAFAVQLERHFRHQGEIHFLAGQGGSRGDEAGVAPHHLHQADAVVHAMRLDVRRVDDFLGLLDGGEVAERAVDVLHIVVDGLGDSDDRDLQIAALDLLAMSCAPRWVPSPPTVNSMLMPRCSRKSTTMSALTGPRDVPSNVPPI